MQLNVVFPIHELKNNKNIIDPNNLNTVWEYYLFENLSCGLVRDSQTEAAGYSGCIAEKFFQENKKNWTFQIRKMKWSNGEDVTAVEVENWISNLLNKNFRHLKYLKNVESFFFQKETMLLKLNFKDEVSTEILHELSLSDASLYVTPLNWTKTSGPYSVKNSDMDKMEIVLKKNEYSPLAVSNMPESINMSRPSIEKIIEMAQSKSTDIIPVSSIVRKSVYEQIKFKNSEFFSSSANQVHYFIINKNCDLSKNSNLRAIFNEGIINFQKEIDIESKSDRRLYIENQLIPYGFHGRVDDYISSSRDDISIGNKIKINISIFTYLKDYPELIELLVNEFKKKNILVNFIYSDRPFESDSNDVFAVMNSFLGNQMDVSGSWEFLLGSEKSPLGQWRYLVQKEYDEAFKATGKIEREKAFQALHKKVLDENIAIPLFVGSQKYYVSDRIDVSAWSKLDARMRFYLIKMK